MCEPIPLRPISSGKFRPDCDSFMAHHSSCAAAFAAVVDRSVHTPTSVLHPSTTQRGRQTEEDRQVWVPTQQPIHQFATCPNHLARQTHERIYASLELQPQHPRLLLTAFLSPASPGLRQGQRPPRLQIPRQGRHHHVCPIALQGVRRRLQRPHPTVQLRQQVLLVAPVVRREHHFPRLAHPVV